MLQRTDALNGKLDCDLVGKEPSIFPIGARMHPRRQVAVANPDRCAAPCPRLRPAIPPASKLENSMRKAIRSLNGKSAGGDIEPKADTFTSGYVRETAQGYTSVSDDAVIDAAPELLSQRIAKGPLLASPRAVRDCLRLRFADLQRSIAFPGIKRPPPRRGGLPFYSRVQLSAPLRRAAPPRAAEGRPRDD